MKIEMPSQWQYSTEIEVRVSDLNYGNHMGNQQFLAYAQEARVRFLAENGFTELDFGGVSLIQADAAITYSCEGRLGDQIKIAIATEVTGRSSFNVFYQFTNLTQGKHMANIRTALISYDYEKNRPIGLTTKALESGVFKF
ncbi:MAG: thioesterase family protein [Bacteroidia bacterium]|jgi:acyl-CoA thioesterase FadM|nr:thioesterase family protein [Bacteroidia bacterium]